MPDKPEVKQEKVGQEQPQPTSVDPPPSGEPTGVEAAPLAVVTPPVIPVAPQGGQAKTVELPTSALKKIKEQAREQGRKAAQTTFDTQLKEAGFSSLKEAFSALSDLKNPKEKTDMAMEPNKPNGKPKGKPKGRGDQRNGNGEGHVSHREHTKVMRLYEKEQGQRKKLMAKWRKEEKSRRGLQKQLDAKDAEMQLREAAILAGVKDIDYAIRLLTRELKGKTKEELTDFKETEFFAGLNESHPYLFGIEVQTATTGSGTGETPPAPKPGDVAKQGAAGDQIDARAMSREDYQKRLTQLGLDPNAM